ncbi:hypothetical protein RBB50_012768 [Rhinocladiella similis]
MDWTLLPILLLAAPSAIPPTHLHTALNGRPRYLDCFLFCLGMQIPLLLDTLNVGEYPVCAAMTTGEVFRLENQATVMFLQKVLRTGHLVTLEVGHGSPAQKPRPLMYAPVMALVAAFLFHGTINPYLLGTVLILLLSRLLSIASLRARTWRPQQGATAPDVQGDLLILLPEDGWIRLKGAVDDLKAVTSGIWLSRRPRHPRLIDITDWTARLLVYVAVVVLANASDRAKLLMILCTFMGHGSLVLVNSQAQELVMHEPTMKISALPGGVKKYSRRSEMVGELVREVGRSDFAVRLGMMNPE